MKKSLTAGLSALALAASAASVALVGGSTASHAAGTPSSAFGIEATGVVPIEPTPYVESTDGSLVEDSLVEFPGEEAPPEAGALLSAGLINVGAKNNHAYASVTDLTLGDGLLDQLPDQLTDPLRDNCNELATALADLEAGIDDGATAIEQGLGDTFDALDEGTKDSPLITKLLADLDNDLTAIELAGVCDSLVGDAALATVGAVEAECTGTTGATTITDATFLGGVDVDVFTTTINSALGVEDAVMVRENRQTENADGTFTVDGLVVQLGPGSDAESEIVISSATCGEVTRDVAEQRDEAPAPTPVEANLAVTG